MKFFHKGVQVFDLELIKKIKRDSKICWWHHDFYEGDPTFSGYVDDEGLTYDVCHLRFSKQEERIRKKREEFQKKFQNFFDSVTGSTKNNRRFY